MQTRNILASILFVLISFSGFAQDPPSPSGPGFPPPPGLPIDGAIPIAILAALFIGVRKNLKKDKAAND